MPAMLGCSTACPKCRHEFTCCPRPRRNITLTGGGIVLSSIDCPPQISPSVPLTFVLPTLTPPPSPSPVIATPEIELSRLERTVNSLKMCGWYYEDLTFSRSDELLKNTKQGTFLVRDSSDPRFLFSLSVQTERGPKSVRLFYVNGLFRLDAQAHLQHTMPLFEGVLELVEYYAKRKKDTQVWVDPQGKCLSPIVLDQPLRKENKPASLKHLARLSINKALRDPSKLKILKLELPSALAKYLAEYPYSL